MSFKYIRVFLTASILILIVVSCKNKDKSYIPTTTIIEGQIISSESPVIVLKNEQEYKSPMDPNGKFLISTELDKPGIYSLLLDYQRIFVFIEPGDRITITGDVRNLTTSTKFSGDHANENNYLLAFENLKQETRPTDFEAFYTQSEEEFLAAVDARTASLNTDQQEYQKKNGPFDVLFANMLGDEISYEGAIAKMNYPAYNEYIHPDSTIKLSDTYDSFLQNIEIDADKNLFLPAYKEFLPVYLDYKMRNDTLNKSITQTQKKFNLIGQLFTGKSIKNYMYYQLMSQTIDYAVNEATPIMDKFQTVQTNMEYKAEINAKYARWTTLLQGQPAPDFTCMTPTGKSVSLQSLKGKIVYIDVWATWCGPCLRELPYLEKLQEETKSNDIVFVSVSIDQDKNAWETMVKSKNMKGTQLYAENAWNAPIVANYFIQGIPRFILIGKDGNIINSNAPRPSSSDIRKELSEALGS